MATNTFTGTTASVEALAADTGREHYCVQLIDASGAVTLAFGRTAIANEGIVLSRIGDSVKVTGWLARKQLNVIGNNGICTYEIGDIVLTQGPTPAA